jgi:tetratricopeptide (TPR) repeat protein/tRNA A-37 threonylcarbamoyl transferase component Bud32
MNASDMTRRERGPAERFDELTALHELERRMFGFDTAMPIRVGRYTLSSPLGRGGLADVFRARDPDLDREVAVKIVRRPCTTHRERNAVLAEARSLARLSHPNIVPVYDVGVCAPDLQRVDDPERALVYIVMELVEGAHTLRDWLRTNASPRERLRACVQAGEGLAAAHAAGILHRDFKPDNVLVAGERVQVIDFGLARTLAWSGRDVEVTRDGKAIEVTSSASQVAGTPVYMAPEQHEGGPIGIAADVFAYCVCMIEALWGERPFAGASDEELRQAKLRGAPRLSARRGVSMRLARVLRRGLAPVPGDRPPLSEILAAARARLARPRRVAAVGATIATALAVTAAYRGWEHARDASACDDTAHALEDTWNPDARTALTTALADRVEDAAATRIAASLDAWVARWLDARRTACEDTAVHRTNSTQDLTLRGGCLDRARAELSAVVELLGPDVDPQVVEHAIDMTHELPDVSRCLDVAVLREEPLPADSDEVAADVAALRTELARIRVLQRAGLARRAATELGAIAAHEAVLRYDPLAAEIAARRGSVLSALGDATAAERSLERAYELARRTDHHAVAKEAALDLVIVVGSGLGRTEDGHRWAHLARIELERRATPSEWAELEIYTAAVLSKGGDSDAAIARLRAAIDRLESQPPPATRVLAVALHNLGGEHVEREEPELARPLLERAFELNRSFYGDAHPRVARALFSLARVQRRLGELPAAERGQREALQILERNPASPTFEAVVRMHLGANLLTQERPAEARVALLAALEVFAADEDARGYEALAQAQLGLADHRLGDLDAARRGIERGLALHEARRDAELAGLARGWLGRLLLDLGEVEHARSELVRAIEATAGDPGRAASLAALARLQLQEGEREAAVRTARDALDGFAEDAFVERRPAVRRDRARTRWVLARAIAIESPGEAREQAMLARETLGEMAEPDTVAAIDAWLDGS